MGKEFNSADKGKTFKQGGDMKKMSMGGSAKASSMGTVKTAAPSRDGIASKGKTKGTMVKMAGNSIGTGPAMKKGGMAKGGMAMKRGGKC